MAAANKADFLETHTLKELLGVPDALLDQAMGIAFQLYQTGRHADAEKICRGLIACNHHYWWSYSLLAGALRALGRFDEALAAVDSGLKHEPSQPKLLAMRADLSSLQRLPRTSQSRSAASAGR